MKGILPTPCRITGYTLLGLTIFTPMLVYLSGLVDDNNLAYIKNATYLSIWAGLFIIFISRTRHEDNHVQRFRSKSLEYAFITWGGIHLISAMKNLITGNPDTPGTSSMIIFMSLCVIYFEFMTKRYQIAQQFKNKKQNPEP